LFLIKNLKNMLKYALYKSNLPNAQGKYIAYSQVEKVATLEDLINDMTSRGSTVTRAEVYSIWEELSLAIVNRIKNVEEIYTPIFNVGINITGKFDSPDDVFKVGRNEVVLNITAGSLLKDITSQISVTKVEATKLFPEIKELTNHSTNSQTEIKAGNYLRILGANLKIDVADESQGIFFIGSDQNEFRLISLIDNLPSNLSFIVPNTLAVGIYRMEIRVKINNGKELRTTTHNKNLTVV
jgi:hypothetical protein